MKIILSIILELLTSALQLPAFAQGTAFTYQGWVDEGSSSASGSFDIAFSLWDTAGGPAQVGATVTNLAVEVNNGLFTTPAAKLDAEATAGAAKPCNA